MRIPTIAFVGCLALAAGGCSEKEAEVVAEETPQASAEDRAKFEIVNAARRACEEVIRAKIPRATVQGMTPPEVWFDVVPNHGKGNEFYFAWSSGTIHGASRKKPDRLTGSMAASASCIGTYSPREISSLTVNGSDVISEKAKIF